MVAPDNRHINDAFLDVRDDCIEARLVQKSKRSAHESDDGQRKQHLQEDDVYLRAEERIETVITRESCSPRRGPFREGSEPLLKQVFS